MLIVVVVMTATHGSFSGQPLTRWLTEENADRRMTIEEDFRFTDPEGKSWEVPSGYCVDGATIPRSLWTLVGSPYTGDYRRASIIHDKACCDAKDNYKARRAADRMFYHACRAGGCSPNEASLLYLGVRIGALQDQLPLFADSIDDSLSPRARESVPAVERRVEADFQIAFQHISSIESTDDPFKLEDRVDQALEYVYNISLSGRDRSSK
jgi:Protein of unknown function (DUF1353)